MEILTSSQHITHNLAISVENLPNNRAADAIFRCFSELADAGEISKPQAQPGWGVRDGETRALLRLVIALKRSSWSNSLTLNIVVGGW